MIKERLSRKEANRDQDQGEGEQLVDDTVSDTNSPTGADATKKEVDLKRLDEAEVSEVLISQSLLKRKEWAKKYRVSDAVLFDLFSEFSSMIMIAKVE